MRLSPGRLCVWVGVALIRALRVVWLGARIDISSHLAYSWTHWARVGSLGRKPAATRATPPRRQHTLARRLGYSSESAGVASRQVQRGVKRSGTAPSNGSTHEGERGPTRPNSDHLTTRPGRAYEACARCLCTYLATRWPPIMAPAMPWPVRVEWPQRKRLFAGPRKPWRWLRNWSGVAARP